jgi:non-specific serine/threonine protein kinase
LRLRISSSSAKLAFIGRGVLSDGLREWYHCGVSQDPATDVQRLFDELIGLAPSERRSRFSELSLAPPVSSDITSLLDAADRVGDFLGVLHTRDRATEASRKPGCIVAGRYRIERELGNGAAGVVYLAHDQQLDRQVALKFLRASANADPTALERFISEARAAARLDHPNVAAVHDIVTMPDGELFIAMAYCPKGTLRERVACGPLAASDVLRIGAQIASGLGAAHAAGIVHRDVKPANVLFDADDVVRLADFGVAKLSTGEDRTSDGVVVGTVAYMSPEQIRGEPVDNRSDLWSLGIVIYEMLSGRRPFSGDHVGSLLHSVLNDDPAPLPDDSQISPSLRALLSSLLAKNPLHRPTDAASVCANLNQLSAGNEVLTAVRPEVAASALPYEVTSFIGRERELKDAAELLRSTRLLTLTGPGGTGKTRLAMRLARESRDGYPDGIWFVPLVEIADPDLVATVTAQALGLRDLGGGRLSERVVATLRDRHVLLVLDNFEHVLGAANFVAALLTGCPNATVLVTSRAPLALQGEQEFPVPPLVTPLKADASAADSEAVQLFVQRARAVRPDFAANGESIDTIAEICRRLDGLPLALELAAARAKLLSPRAMLSRLEHRFDLLRGEASDRPSRHGTMRDVIDWSYVLLTEAERKLFDQLSVFAGSISVEAAEAAIAERYDESERRDSAFAVLDTLGSLCNKSLLRHEDQADGEPRFMMLETVREFGLDRLRATGGEAEARRAHRVYYMSLAERGAAQLRGPNQAVWLDRLESEYANCRIALDGALAEAAQGAGTGLTDATRLALALHRLWFTRGPLLEGDEYLRRTIALAEKAALDPAQRGLDAAVLARLLTGAAQMANTRSVFPEARDLLERSLELQRQVDDEAGVATTLNNLGWAEWIIGDLSKGEELSNAAMVMHLERGDELGVTLSRNNLAWIAMERGQYAQSEELFAQVIESHRGRGDRRSTAFSMGWIGLLAARRGDYARAIRLHEEAIEMLEPVAERGYRALSFVRLAAALHAASEPGNHAATIEFTYLPLLWEEGRLWPIASALTELGAMLRDAGQLDRARNFLVESLDVRRQTGALHGVAEARLLLGTVYHRDGDRARATESMEHALRDATIFGAAPVVIDCIESVGALLLDDGRAERAATLFGAARSERDRLGACRAPRYMLEDAQLRERLDAELGEAGAARAIAEGAALGIDDARTIAFDSLHRS